MTRGYEPDCTATIPAGKILNYLEQLRWEFIRDPESGLQEHLASGHFPVLRAQRIEMVQRVGMDTPLNLFARVLKVGRNIVSIEHHVIDANTNTLVAHAIVDGIFLGPNRRPVRIPDGFLVTPVRGMRWFEHPSAVTGWTPPGRAQDLRARSSHWHAARSTIKPHTICESLRKGLGQS